MVIPGIAPPPSASKVNARSPSARNSGNASSLGRRTSGFFSSLFGRKSGAALSGSSNSVSSSNATLPSYEDASRRTTINKSTGTVQKIRMVPKKDTNIVFINMGSLSPENFDMLEIKALTSPPPSCSSCSAVLSTSQTCFFCGTHHSSLPESQLQTRRAAEEYNLVQGMSTGDALPKGAATSIIRHDNDQGLVVFCVDISGSSKSCMIIAA